MNASPTDFLLAVDIGNNQLKFGLMPAASGAAWPEPRSVFKVARAGWSWDGLQAWLPAQRLTWCVATVHREAERRLAEWVAEHRTGDRYRLLQNRVLPLEIRVEEPERVGSDRLLAALAAKTLRLPDRAAIVIDAGTAITVDLVSADGAFQGGVILPGLGLMARALARDTDLLPYVEGSWNDAPPPVVGKSTVAAIRSGLYWGSVGAVCEVVRRMAAELNGDPQVFVAGGDAAKLQPFLPATAHIVPELVLSGIALAWQSLTD
jgi:type III pantothenate kinase